MHGTIHMKRNMRAEVQSVDPLVKMNRLIRKARESAHDVALQKLGRQEIEGPVEDVGTGNTIMKLRDHPLAKLIKDHQLVPEAITAADEIHTAFHAIASRVMIRPGSLERIDGRGRGDMPWPAKVSRAVANYQAFARHWTKRANLGDPMLQVLIAVVIDQRSFRDVAQEVAVHHSRVRGAVMAGLQDYAARSESITRNLPRGVAGVWMDEAEQVFPIIRVGLRISRAKSRIAAAALKEAVDAAQGAS